MSSSSNSIYGEVADGKEESDTTPSESFDLKKCAVLSMVYSEAHPLPNKAVGYQEATVPSGLLSSPPTKKLTHYRESKTQQKIRNGSSREVSQTPVAT